MNNIASIFSGALSAFFINYCHPSDIDTDQAGRDFDDTCTLVWCCSHGPDGPVPPLPNAWCSDDICSPGGLTSDWHGIWTECCVGGGTAQGVPREWDDTNPACNGGGLEGMEVDPTDTGLWSGYDDCDGLTRVPRQGGYTLGVDWRV